MTSLIVQEDRLRSNIRKIQSEVGVRMIGVLKGNGYGLDIVKFANVLKNEGITMFAVCELWEARALRDAGFHEEILLMRSTAMPDEADDIVSMDLTATIGSAKAAKALDAAAAAQSRRISAHLELDSGFGRYGFDCGDAESAVNAVSSLQNVDVRGVYTHFSNAFGEESCTKTQLDRFLAAVDKLKSGGLDFDVVHAANSCGALRFPYARLDAVRIGSAFLGRLPISNRLSLDRIGVLRGNVIEIRNVKAGQNIGYANVCSVKRDTRIAVVPVGYFDGYGMEKSHDTFRPRDIARYTLGEFKRLFSKPVLRVDINGKKATLLGRVCMRNVVLDVTDIPCSIGDEVFFPVNTLFVDEKIERLYVTEKI